MSDRQMLRREHFCGAITEERLVSELVSPFAGMWSTDDEGESVKTVDSEGEHFRGAI